MSADVVELDAYRPHATVSCDAGHVHVLPLAYLRDVAGGARAVAPLPPCVARRILTEWLAGFLSPTADETPRRKAE